MLEVGDWQTVQERAATGLLGLIGVPGRGGSTLAPENCCGRSGSTVHGVISDWAGRLGGDTVWLLNPDSGRVRRRWRLPGPVATDADGVTPFVSAPDGRVLVRSGDRWVLALDPRGGVDEI